MRAIMLVAALAACAWGVPASAQSAELLLAVDRYMLTPYGPVRFETKAPRARETKAAYPIDSAWQIKEEPTVLFFSEDLPGDTRFSYGFISVPDNVDWRYTQYPSQPFGTEQKLILGVHLEWTLGSAYELPKA